MSKHVSKATEKKAHDIAKAIKREHPSGAMNPYAVGMAAAKKASHKRGR